ncbi:hypothetical protein MMC18_007229 [Xylographa bjoerkii]|nr:hypothetical protein [Xylographa bjoerkii]
MALETLALVRYIDSWSRIRFTGGFGSGNAVGVISIILHSPILNEELLLHAIPLYRYGPAAQIGETVGHAVIPYNARISLEIIVRKVEVEGLIHFLFLLREGLAGPWTFQNSRFNPQGTKPSGEKEYMSDQIVKRRPKDENDFSAYVLHYADSLTGEVKSFRDPDRVTGDELVWLLQSILDDHDDAVGVFCFLKSLPIFSSNMCQPKDERRTVYSTHFPPYTYLKTYVDYCDDIETCPVFLMKQLTPQAAAAAALEVRKEQKARKEVPASEPDEEDIWFFDQRDEEELESVIGPPIKLSARGTMAKSTFKRPRRRDKHQKRDWTEFKALEHNQRRIISTRREIARGVAQLVFQEPGFSQSQLFAEILEALGDTADIAEMEIE